MAEILSDESGGVHRTGTFEVKYTGLLSVRPVPFISLVPVSQDMLTSLLHTGASYSIQCLFMNIGSSFMNKNKPLNVGLDELERTE